ncbi:SDR family NAD(P)-dependent oxidoreductase [Sphingomonas sp. 2378]|uniref:SDR family NAD(P)-dependent oxidoreductase n=1 Tax=Sphingomonas sp. 2378 TaxID=1219748 RepID=UPI00311B34FF
MDTPEQGVPLLSGRVAIVTGSTAGLGRGIAVALAKAGAKVVVNGRVAERAAAVMAELDRIGADALFVAGDVGEEDVAPELVAATIARFGRLDILVNNAQARVPYSRLESAEIPARVTTMLHSGLYGSLWAAQAAFPHLCASGHGRIINFGSLNGVSGARFAGPYNVTKSAIEALTRTMANEWGRHGITANAVLPSGMSESYARFFADDPARGERAARANPMRRHGDPERDIGAAVVGLAADDARYITGQSLFVDGGQSVLGMPQFHQLED